MTNAIHPAKGTVIARARALYHATRRLPAEEGTAFVAEALEMAERYGHRDPEVDGFAVLRHALVEACWTLELGGDLTERLRQADAILRAAVCLVDGEEDAGTCFREAAA